MTVNMKWLASLGLTVLLLGVAGCGGTDDNSDAAGSGDKKSDQEKSQAQGPQPDLKGIPDIVAEVNGEEIAKEDFVKAYEGQFQQAAMQSQASGQQPDQDQLKKQVVEQMIGTELLVQEADSRNFTASPKAIDRTLNELTQQSGLKSPDQFMAAMKKQGMGEQEVRSELETQVKVDRLITEEAGNTEPTGQEVKQLYGQLVAQQKQSGAQGQGSKIPPLGQVRPQLEEQVKAQKESQAAQALISDFRKDADVTINL